MLSLQLWYPNTNLRDLCRQTMSIAGSVGLELCCDPAEKVDMGMVGSWEIARLGGRPVFLGLTEGDMHFGIVTVFTDAEDQALTSEFERLLAAVWRGPGPPYPSEGSLVKGMDDVQGPMLCLFPVTSRLIVLILRQVGEPGDTTFAPHDAACLENLTRDGVVYSLPMKSKVSVVRCAPETILDDVDRLCGLAEVEKHLAPGKTTILKDNISWHFPFPGANTTPWQLEGTILALRKRGYDDQVCVQNKTVVTNAFKGEDLNKYLPIFGKYKIPVLYNFKPADMKWIPFSPKSKMRVLNRIFPEGSTRTTVVTPVTRYFATTPSVSRQDGQVLPSPAAHRANTAALSLWS
ncbi:MAG: hypothetical protein HY303_03740 [Candidatus Wallbacteria bacterium]|nr:hypothetical protein [Candidatus Wallbacteria bacterium]